MQDLLLATSSSEPVRTNVDGLAPSVLVIAGMDAPPTPRMLATWTAACSALPDHRVVLATLLHNFDDSSRCAYPLELAADVPQRGRSVEAPSYRYRCGERLARRTVTALMRWADERAEYDEDGRARNWIGERMAGPIALPLKYLYDPAHEARQRARVLALLRDPRVTTVVGGSFGGSIALDCLIRFRAEGLLPASRKIRLLTLGSNLGCILTRSRLYRALPHDAHGKIAVPHNVHWQHFVSPSDVFVGASARPRGFGSCEQIEVETGPLLVWPPNQAHAMGRYLATPQVRQALQDALQTRPSVNSAPVTRASAALSV
jgi:pimeloyl-ACP methyl ester carboxylesterase